MSAEFKVEVGQFSTRTASLTVWAKIKSDGSQHIEMFASDPSDFRKAGVFFMLEDQQFEEVTKLLQKSHIALADLKVRFNQQQTPRAVTSQAGGFCISCGVASTPDARFCSHCGAPIQQLTR